MESCYCAASRVNKCRRLVGNGNRQAPQSVSFGHSVPCFLHVHVKVDLMLRTIVPFFIVGLLTACNGGEDFPGAGSGPIVGLPGGDQPIPTPEQDAVAIELVVALDDNGTVRTARVTNLGYECTGSRSFIPAAGEAEGWARCHPSADSVAFFIGADGATGDRFYLGKIFLPICTARSTQNECKGGEGFFQFTLADLVPGTAPKRSRHDNPEVRNRAALLAALDANPDNKVRIDIPADAHVLAGMAPSPLFGEQSYAAFVGRWDGWLAMVSSSLAPIQPLAFPATSEQAEQLALAAMNRSRMGTFEMVHNPAFYPTQGYPLMELRLPFSVNGDGVAFGVGLVIGGTAPAGEQPLDFIALDSGVYLDSQMIMRNIDSEDLWNSKTVIDPLNSSLSFSGRFIGPAVYDGLSAVSDSTKTDYSLDYRLADAANFAVEDKGRFTGISFSDSFNAAPYRSERTGAVSAFLHTDVMLARPRFYRLSIYRACVEDPASPTCDGQKIPEVEKALNYPKIAYFDDNGDVQVFEPEFELLRNEFYDGTIQIEILDDGTVVLDSDADCSAVAPSPESLTSPVKVFIEGDGSREWPVGFVSRTHMPSASEKSLNLALFFAGPAAQGSETERNQENPAIPHYGTRIEGRINLELPQMPMYRLSDGNFEDAIRTVWVDNIQGEMFARGFSGGEPPLVDVFLNVALRQGAVAGVAVDPDTCAPVPVLP